MYIGIDVGGTNIRVAAIENLEKVKITRVEKCLNENNFEVDIQRMIELIYKVSDSKPGDRVIQAIGIGVPGVVDDESTRIVNSGALNSWHNQPIKEILEKEFFTEVILRNDALVAALGETYYGHGKDQQDYLFLIWGTGIGGTEVIRIGNEVHVFPFEPGHHKINYEGKYEGFEEFVGGRGIEKYFGKPAKDLEGSEWELVENMFAIGLNNIIAMRNTDLIVFSGGIASNQHKHVKNASQKTESLLWSGFKMPEVKISQFGEDTGLYGAFALILHDGVINSRLRNVYA